MTSDFSIGFFFSIEKKSEHWGCYYATAVDIEVDPQCCGLGSCQSDFALQAVVECRALEPECFGMAEKMVDRPNVCVYRYPSCSACIHVYTHVCG